MICYFIGFILESNLYKLCSLHSRDLGLVSDEISFALFVLDGVKIFWVGISFEKREIRLLDIMPCVIILTCRHAPRLVRVTSHSWSVFLSLKKCDKVERFWFIFNLLANFVTNLTLNSAVSILHCYYSLELININNWSFEHFDYLVVGDLLCGLH